ncbi:MAG: hypothetical protein EPN72_03825 [Nevskiaceae bacterium]|nr:MAG: hypothetical protein EPN63_06605 [Nevskiaceae bacterium]TBR73951.1 MAG: hypothetical protein EPN72_03825 [Nevskiaceae bacterium]
MSYRDGSAYSTARKLASAVLLLVGLSMAVAASAAARVTLPIKAFDSAGRTLGTLAPGQILSVVVALAPRDTADLKALIHAQRTLGDPHYRQFLTSQGFASRYAPTAAQARQVVDWMTSAGFQNVQLAPNRLLVSADATPAVAEAAFGTVLRSFAFNGRMVFANMAPVSVPDSIGGIVTAVLGLQDVAQARTFVEPGAVTFATGAVRQLQPPQVAAAYGASTLPAATSTTVGVFVAGDLQPVMSDLQSAQAQFGMPTVAVQEIQTGRSSTVYTDTTNTTEWDLDFQSILGMGGNFRKILAYNSGTLANADLLPAFARWVSDNQARYASASFGECEGDAINTGFMKALDPILQQAVAQGQTLFAASGDDFGANTPNCPALNLLGVNVGAQNVNYPASSPYVTAVGGTTLSTDSAGHYASESAWNGTIGGISGSEAAPSWQQGLIPPSGLLTGVLSGPPTTRAIPDLALVGDPASGMLAIVNGQRVVVGGTSLSAPLVMAGWARVEQAVGRNAGFAAPAIYTLYKARGTAAGFNDITTGSNNTYSAAAGWDYVSGLGSLDFNVIAQALAQTGSTVAPSPTQPPPTDTATPPPPAPAPPPTQPTSPTSSPSGGGSSGGGAALPGLLLAGLVLGALRRRRHCGA